MTERPNLRIVLQLLRDPFWNPTRSERCSIADKLEAELKKPAPVVSRPMQRVLVMADSNGYGLVWADPYYDQFEDDRTFFSLNISGRDACGRRVTVAGRHIACVYLAAEFPGAKGVAA